jgi:hypothetical protein
MAHHEDGALIITLRNAVLASIAAGFARVRFSRRHPKISRLRLPQAFRKVPIVAKNGYSYLVQNTAHGSPKRGLGNQVNFLAHASGYESSGLSGHILSPRSGTLSLSDSGACRLEHGEKPPAIALFAFWAELRCSPLAALDDQDRDGLFVTLVIFAPSPAGNQERELHRCKTLAARPSS